MNIRYVTIFLLVTCALTVVFVSADRLPSQVPENQIYTITTLVDTTGSVSEESSMEWVIDDQNLESSEAYSPDLDGDTFNSIWLADFILQYAHDWVEPLDLLSLILKYDGVKLTTVDRNDDLYQFVPVFTLIVPSTYYDVEITPLLPGLTFREMLNDLKTGRGNYQYHIQLAYDSGYIHNGRLNPTEEIGILTWSDSLRSNGGKIALNKNIEFDSQNKTRDLSNLETEKVLTYTNIGGAHLVGAEAWTLDVAGNWEGTVDSIRCVFASSDSEYLPAFCNLVKANSDLVNMNSVQTSTKGSSRLVASSSDITADLNYQIAITPDSNSKSGYADGTVKTIFGGSIMEAQGQNLVPSSSNTWKDTTSVTGGIKDFQKSFYYESGFAL